MWELWTTREGLEAWWAPDGNRFVVRALDVRPGGELVFEATATTPDQIEWQTGAGIPVTTVQRIVYTEVEPPRRLGYRNVIDFVPGVEPYEVDNVVESRRPTRACGSSSPSPPCTTRNGRGSPGSATTASCATSRPFS